jgi:hypothetical protein
MDTASSLRQNREAVAAAAVEHVVNQIQRNSKRRQRLTRKQRQKQRRQRQREQEAATATGVEAAAAVAAVEATAAAAYALHIELPNGAATICAHAGAALHWQHAAAEVAAAFQPRIRLLKRQRVAVAAG